LNLNQENGSNPIRLEWKRSLNTALLKLVLKRASHPLQNYKRDLDDIPEEVKSHLKIDPVDRIEDVLSKALL